MIPDRNGSEQRMNAKRFFTLSAILIYCLGYASQVTVFTASGEASNLPHSYAAIPGLTILANYAHDWVNGETAASDTVTITLKESDGITVKAIGNTTSDSSGDYAVECSEWTGGVCPDIVPGDIVEGTTGFGHGSSVRIGQIKGIPNPTTDIVNGTINASWIGGTVSVRCEIWNPSGAPAIDTTATANGGAYTCDFGAVGWDLQNDHVIAVKYLENEVYPDVVINILNWPWMRTNYSYDWVGGNYEAGHTFTINVTDSVGALKATAEVDSEAGEGWAEEDGFETSASDWSPSPPDILSGDWVYYNSEDGYSNTIHVGAITANLDIVADRVTGTILVPGETGTLPVECHPWGAWNDGISSSVAEIKYSSADAEGGNPTFSCDWSGSGYDVLPGQDIAVMYIESDLDRIIEVVMQPFDVFLPLVMD